MIWKFGKIKNTSLNKESASKNDYLYSFIFFVKFSSQTNYNSKKFNFIGKTKIIWINIFKSIVYWAFCDKKIDLMLLNLLLEVS
jgi:hypothetical protein